MSDDATPTVTIERASVEAEVRALNEATIEILDVLSAGMLDDEEDYARDLLAAVQKVNGASLYLRSVLRSKDAGS